MTTDKKFECNNKITFYLKSPITSNPFTFCFFSFYFILVSMPYFQLMLPSLNFNLNKLQDFERFYGVTSRINYTNRKASKIIVDAFLYDEITVLSKIKNSIVRHKKRGQLSHAYQSFYFFLI